jgi:hypothetical protein
VIASSVASPAPRTFPGIGVVDLVTKLDVATLRIDHCITSVEVITYLFGAVPRGPLVRTDSSRGGPLREDERSAAESRPADTRGRLIRQGKPEETVVLEQEVVRSSELERIPLASGHGR